MENNIVSKDTVIWYKFDPEDESTFPPVDKLVMVSYNETSYYMPIDDKLGFAAIKNREKYGGAYWDIENGGMSVINDHYEYKPWFYVQAWAEMPNAYNAV